MATNRTPYRSIAPAIGLSITLTVTLALSGCTSTYLGRIASLRGPDVEDYHRLPTRPVAAGVSRPLAVRPQPEWMTRHPFTIGPQRIDSPAALERLLSENGTTAFIVLEHGAVVDERYFGGYGRESLYKSFSISKSVLSAMFGIAASEGFVSPDDTLGQYLGDGIAPALGSVTLQSLLDNLSGFKYERGFAPWKQQPRMYYTTDIRDYVHETEVVGTPGAKFSADDLSPLLLGLALETALRRERPNATLSDYASRRLWAPLGAEHQALWVLDRAHDGMEKTESGFVARAMDLARFGQLYLDRGRVGTTQIVPETWISTSVAPPPRGAPNRFVEGYYRNLWWGYFRRGRTRDDFYANGHFGQRIYVSPDRSLVIVRMGKRTGDVDWTEFCARIADAWRGTDADAKP